MTRKTTEEKEFDQLWDEAVDFLNEARGLIVGSGLLKRERENPLPMVACMALTMLMVELMINNMHHNDGEDLEPSEVNKLLHSMIDSVVRKE